jgi:histidinol-phosphatase
MASFRARDLVVETKPDLTPVSAADRAVEQAIRQQLAADRPDDAILGEEYGQQGTSRRRWVIDPIDGTKNYVRGVPVWATLIALLDGDDVVVGVVSAPALARRWWAAQGLGAFCTDPGTAEPRRLQVSAVGALSDASFSYADTWRQRAYGDFWSHMMVAEGVVDVAAEPQLESYDVAALIPIVQEAGGTLTAFDGGSAIAGGSALSSNGLLHPEVVQLVNS